MGYVHICILNLGLARMKNEKNKHTSVKMYADEYLKLGVRRFFF